MHKNRFLSHVVEDSEPARNQNFTDLLAELRVAQVSCIRISTVSDSRDCHNNSHMCKKGSVLVIYE